MDGTLTTNKFSFIFSGDKLYSYKITILNAVTGASVYAGSTELLELYNGDLFEAAIPAASFTNGTDLIWSARLTQANADMKVVASTCQSGSTTTSIKIRPNSAIKVGMNMTIGAETKAISAFTNYLPISNSTLRSGSTYNIIKIATGLTPANVLQYTLMIDTQKRTIINYNAATGEATVSPAFTSLYASGTAYNIIDERTAVATTSAFASPPALGTPYTVYTAFIDTPNYFFKARTTPVVTVTSGTLGVVDSRKYTFEGSYTQDEGIGVKYHIFNLYDETDTLLATSGQVYSEFLEWEYDALVSGITYSIDLIILNQENTEVSTGKEVFTVSYGVIDFDNSPDVTNLPEDHAIQIEWVGDKQSIGVASGTVSYEEDVPFVGTNSVYIETGDVTFDSISGNDLNISPSAYTIFTNINIPITKNGRIIALTDDAVSGYGEIALLIESFKFYNEITDPYFKSIYAPYTKTEIVLADPIPTLSLMTATGTPTAGTGYVWDDTDTWDDADIWTETDTADTIQLKITMIPDYDIQVVAVTAP